MADPFVGEIRAFGFNFPPKGWALCNGQLMPISQNTALFALLGTYYGGDGRSTFALPNLRDSVPVGWGQGQGLSERFLGEQGGSPYVSLLQSEIPAHNHTLRATSEPGEDTAPSGRTLGRSVGASLYGAASGADTVLAPQALAVIGGSGPHNNYMPSLVLNYCIALQGVFPPRP